MDQKLFILFIFIAVVFLNSCKEKFDDYTIKNAPDAIVIEGTLTDKPGPYLIKISKAVAYNDANNLPAVSGAKVTISDDKGNQELLKEKTAGNYMTDTNGILGIVGRNYTLTVQTSDGYVYQSSPSLLSPALQIDSVYSEITEQTSLINNSPITMPVIQLYVDVSSPSKSNFYFKANLDLIRELSVSEKTRNRGVIATFHWDYYNTGPTIKLADKGISIKKLPVGTFKQGRFSLDVFNNIQEILSGQKIGSVVSCYLPIQDVTVIGWIATFNVYALNQTDYAYYKRLVDQINATDRLFDPISTQLQGNINCLTDSKKIVLGNFTVAAKITKSAMFHYNNISWETKKILDFPNVNYSDCDTLKPSWWQFF